MATDSIAPAAIATAVSGNHLAEEVQGYFQTLLSRLCWPGGDEPESPLRTLGLTSCYRGEGVSTVAAQLAVAAASSPTRRVLLVDANVSKPSTHRTFHVESEPGLIDVLDDVARLEAAIQPTSVDGLSVLASGKPAGNSRNALESSALTDVLKRVTADYDLVVFDLPACGEPGFAPHLAALLDGLVLVVEAERVRWEVARRTSELLRRGRVHLLGAVLNKRRQHVPSWLYRTL